MTDLYHFTDTAHLPYILASGELRPTLTTVGDYPSLLWATSDPRGDRTASASTRQAREGWRNGSTRLVRIAVDAAGWMPWHEIRQTPAWRPDHIDDLERRARAWHADPAGWWCFNGSLPHQQWLSVETRTYAGDWEPLPSDVAPMFVRMADSLVPAIEIGGRIYCSQQFRNERGTVHYATMMIDAKTDGLTREIIQREGV